MNDGYSANRRWSFRIGPFPKHPIPNPSKRRSRCMRAMTAVTVALLMLGPCAASWAGVSARLERHSVRDGDALTLIIESDASQSGKRPDLTVLRKDFDVLATSTNSETRIVNGNVSHLTRWLVQLRPQHAGIITIAPITVGNEQTSALILNVTEGSPEVAEQVARHVFLQVDAMPAGESVYVQQQIPYTVRLYYDNTIQTGELEAPDLENAIVEQLGEEKRYAAMHDEREYNVLERRYAIAPQRSGALVIPPVNFRGTALLARNQGRQAYQVDDLVARMLRGMPFGTDPFFKGRTGPGVSFAAPQAVAARSPEISLEVQPRPPGAQGNWLPAEQITLHDSWEDNPPRFTVGEPVTRTVTIETKGVTGAQIPSLSIIQPGNARLYPEAPGNDSQSDGKAIYGTSRQSVTYIPTAQGALDIAPVELAWWDTGNDVQRRAVLPTRQFIVEPGAAQAQSQAVPPPTVGRASEANSAAPTAELPLQGASSGRVQTHWAWFASGAVLLLVTILSAFAFRRSRRRKSESRQGTVAAQRTSAMRTLRRACADNDARGAQFALLDLAQAEWPDDSPRSLGALAARLEAGGEEISVLDKCLYGTGGARWQGNALWRILKRGLQPGPKEVPRAKDGLGALYAQ